LSKIIFEGTVFSGAGEGSKFISLPWVRRQIEEKLGFTPFSGTLNICLTKGSAMQKIMLEKAKKLEILPQKGFCSGILIEAFIDGLKCGILQPQIPGYPQQVLEVVAAFNLRERLKLVDDSEVCVLVTV
jgi:riboflavin kinase